MRVVIDLPPPPHHLLSVGDPEWIFVVRHSWWIFVWDRVYTCRLLRSHDLPGAQLVGLQWQDENDKVVRKSKILEFLWKEREARIVKSNQQASGILKLGRLQGTPRSRPARTSQSIQ